MASLCSQYLDSNISSTESDVNIYIGKAWTTIDRLYAIWKYDLSNEINWEFLQAVVVSALIYGYTTWTLMKCLEKKLDGNDKRILHAGLNKSWE